MSSSIKNINYEQKYLKYKNKYLELSAKIKGGAGHDFVELIKEVVKSDEYGWHSPLADSTDVRVILTDELSKNIRISTRSNFKNNVHTEKLNVSNLKYQIIDYLNGNLPADKKIIDVTVNLAKRLYPAGPPVPVGLQWEFEEVLDDYVLENHDIVVVQLNTNVAKYIHDSDEVFW
jgi:hypothetical protein